MEDYKKKYEQAMLRMNKWVEGSEIIEPKEVAEFVFPELRESEDEKIRKQLLNWFKSCHWDAIDNETLKRNDIIAWLEKQGEQKPTWSEEDEEIVSMLVSRCNGTTYTSDNLIKMKSWLKSLKERINIIQEETNA